MDTIRVMEDILKKIVSIRKNQEEEDLKNISHLIRNMDDEIYSLIIPRLKKEIEIVKKYKPPVRPAVDPLVSSYLGVYSGLDLQRSTGC